MHVLITTLSIPRRGMHVLITTLSIPRRCHRELSRTSPASPRPPPPPRCSRCGQPKKPPRHACAHHDALAPHSQPTMPLEAPSRAYRPTPRGTHARLTLMSMMTTAGRSRAVAILAAGSLARAGRSRAGVTPQRRPRHPAEIPIARCARAKLPTAKLPTAKPPIARRAQAWPPVEANRAQTRRTG